MSFETMCFFRIEDREAASRTASRGWAAGVLARGMNRYLLLAGLAAAVSLGGLLSGCRLLGPAPARTGPVSTTPAVPLRPKAVDLFEAAETGNLETVRAIVDSNPDLIEQEDAAGWNAAAYAAWNGHKPVYDYLLSQGAATTVFTTAALGPLPDLVQRLRTNPLAVNARDGRYKASPLIWSVRTGNQAALEFLLDLGADVNAPDRSGATALHAAVGGGQLEIGRTLLFAGADPSICDDRGLAALHLAADSGQLQFCVLLLDAGAAPDARDGAGNTALHLAAARGDFELCEYLLFLGAQAGVQNDRGLTPRDVAERAGHRDVAALLRAQGG
jgi:ankyrin repeat protein